MKKEGCRGPLDPTVFIEGMSIITQITSVMTEVSVDEADVDGLTCMHAQRTSRAVL